MMRPVGRRRYKTSLIGEYRNAVLISILDKMSDSDAAMLNNTLILLLDAASANVSKKVDSSNCLGRLVELCIY